MLCGKASGNSVLSACNARLNSRSTKGWSTTRGLPMAGSVRGSSAGLWSSGAGSLQLRETLPCSHPSHGEPTAEGAAFPPVLELCGAIRRCPSTLSSQLGVFTTSPCVFLLRGAFVGTAPFRGGGSRRGSELPWDFCPAERWGASSSGWGRGTGLPVAAGCP